MIINRNNLKKITPKSLLIIYRFVRFIFNKIKYSGSKFYCNICNSKTSSWIYYGPKANLNLVCPVCNSFGRHRMMGMILKKNLILDQINCQKQLLHFAPELGLQKFVKKRFPHIQYRSSDFDNNDADLRLDLMHIELPDNSVDFIILSHVLEHVSDDKLALSELMRVLAPDGKLFLQVPLGKHQKTKDDKFESTEERLLHYGQKDHLRLFALENLYSDLIKIGFLTSIHAARNNEYLSIFHKMALDLPKESKMIYSSESTVFICQKPNKKTN
tara:strand:+ start:671 stop:1486 length:816 start_codon:yes stop_codon:yes gene_type:complete